MIEKVVSKNNVIIGFSGKRGVGKTTAGIYLRDNYDFKLVAFADKLKELSANLFPFSISQLHGELKEMPHRSYSWTPRDFMIKFGSFMRYWDSEYWLNSVNLNAQLQNIAIHDVRYRNEAEYLRSQGARIIRIERYENDIPYKGTISDPSETELDDYNFDFTIQAAANKTLPDLVRSLEYALKKFEYVGDS